MPMFWGEIGRVRWAGPAKTTATYTYGPGGERISQTKSPLAGGASETSYYGVNPHTDVETLTSESGNTRSTYRYTGYGENDGAGFSGKDKATATGGPEVEAYNPYRFNSKRWDPATGGYDMGFRDYSPGLNRFLTRDMYNGALSDLRLGSDPWTGNRYAFAGGNPITGIEFDGHCPMADEGGCDTNANYEIYVPPASSDNSGTQGGDLSETDSLSDFRVTARSHPDRILEMGDGCSHGQRFHCVLPEGGFKALGNDGYGPYLKTTGDKGADAVFALGTLYFPGGAATRGVLAIRAAWAGKALKTPQVLSVGGFKLSAVPKGVVGTPTKTGKGLDYVIPRGTPELSERVAMIRIMDPVMTGKHVYPNGYAVYMNAQGKRVNPMSGQMIHDLSDPFAHIPLP